MHHQQPLPIAHRDLKLENILLSFPPSNGSTCSDYSGDISHQGGNGVVYKVIDFGSAVEGPVPLRNAQERACEEERIEKTTTQMYRAPEMVDLYLRRELDHSVDVWALGCVFFAVLHFVHPFQDAGKLGILNNKRRKVEGVREGESEVQELIDRMLLPDAVARLSIDEVLEDLKCLREGRGLPPRTRFTREEELQQRRAGEQAAGAAGGSRSPPELSLQQQQQQRGRRQQQQQQQQQQEDMGKGRKQQKGEQGKRKKTRR
eukprot:evm.model.NODE_27573_length_56350_cov_23.676434.6